MKIEHLIKQLTNWAQTDKQVEGILLVGSYSRGDAKADSDIDLIILTKNPKLLINEPDWIKTFGVVKEINKEHYGMLTSLRTFYENGLEIEFGITSFDWANINPIDQGTLDVVKNGAKIIFERNKILSFLLESVKNS